MSLKIEDPDSWTFQAVDQKKLKKYNHNADWKHYKTWKGKTQEYATGIRVWNDQVIREVLTSSLLLPNINKIQDRDKKNRKT